MSNAFPPADDASLPDDDPGSERNAQLDAEIERLQRLSAEVRRLSVARFVELDFLSEFHGWLDEMRHLRALGRVTGEPQTGKTLACRAYHLRQRSRQAQAADTVGVRASTLYLRLPPACSPRDLMGMALNQLDCSTAKGYTGAVRSLLVSHLRDRGIRLLLIDNANAQSPKTLAEIHYWAEAIQAGAVLVGTPQLDSVLQRGDGLLAAFGARYSFAPLSGAVFRSVVERWEQDVLKLPEASNLTRRETLGPLLEASNGCLGRLDLILRRSAIRTLKKGLRRIDQPTLEEVLQDYV
jgi:DNA transposition AAA+ family ATPase